MLCFILKYIYFIPYIVLHCFRTYTILLFKIKSLFQKRKERGRIPTDAIHTVEQAQLGELSKQILDDNEKSPAYRYPFQVTHLKYRDT